MNLEYWYNTMIEGYYPTLPIKGWIFPCYFCLLPTCNQKVISTQKGEIVHTPCCKKCKKKSVDLKKLNPNNIILRDHDKPSNY